MPAAILSQLNRLSAVDRPDAELLRAYARQGDERAFQILVSRHGPMVLRVCRNLLGDGPAAEDAFQAAFLVFARKSRQIDPRHGGSVACWLFGCARRTAQKARSAQRRRSRHESTARARAVAGPLDDMSARELCQALDEELAQLPESYRLPLLLCYWQGLSQKDAARRLGVSAGAIKGRLERGRARLSARLTKRGVAPAVLLATAAGVGLPHGLEARTVDVVRPAATIPEAVSRLASAVGSRTLKLSMAATLLVAAAGGLGLWNMWVAASPLPQPPAPEAKKPQVHSELTGLDAFGDSLPAGAIARLGSTRLYHGQTVERVLFSPDDKFIFSSVGLQTQVSAAKLVRNRLWEARTGKEMPLPDVLTSAAFFETQDRLVAVTLEKDHFVLFDGETARELVRFAVGAEQRPVDLDRGLALSADVKTLVWYSPGWARPKPTAASAMVFADAATGAVQQVAAGDDKRQIWSLAFSGDGSTLAAYYLNDSVDVWDVKTRKLVRTVALKSNPPNHIALSADGGTLVSALRGERKIRFWDLRADKEFDALEFDPGRAGNSVSFSRGGKLLAVTREAGVGVWDLAARKEIRRLRGKESNVSAPVFSRDGKRLAAADGNGVSIWDLATGELNPDFGHIYTVNALAFAPDGKTIASGAAYTDNILRTWDPLTGEIVDRTAGSGPGQREIRHSR